jgi:L-2,4-diaminobutyric acid acetyltransferase
MDDAEYRRSRPSMRPVTADDAGPLQQAVLECPPLSLHTPYAYWVMLRAGGSLSVASWRAGQIVGFALGLGLADARVLVWQIGVRSQFRRRGLAQEMLAALWRTAQSQGIDTIEATIDLDNVVSRRVFARFAETHALDVQQIGEAVCRDPTGTIVEREDWFRLAAPTRHRSQSPSEVLGSR